MSKHLVDIIDSAAVLRHRAQMQSTFSLGISDAG
jgi:hypothetical protein